MSPPSWKTGLVIKERGCRSLGLGEGRNITERSRYRLQWLLESENVTQSEMERRCPHWQSATLQLSVSMPRSPWSRVSSI